MYKKYVHPCYSWYNEYYKQLSENELLSSKGELKTLEEINKLIKQDQERVYDGELEISDHIKQYGLLDSSEQEFISNVYDRAEEIIKEIVSSKNELIKLKTLTGVNLEI